MPSPAWSIPYRTSRTEIRRHSSCHATLEPSLGLDSLCTNQISRQKDNILSEAISKRKIKSQFDSDVRARPSSALYMCTRRTHTTRTNKRNRLCLSFLTHPPALSLSLLSSGQLEKYKHKENGSSALPAHNNKKKKEKKKEKAYLEK